MTEKAWQRKVIDAAKWHGWRCVHIRNVEIAPGRYTVPYEGDSGLPDLVLARGGRSLLVELKRDGKKPTRDQQAWLDAAGGYCWTPADWSLVLDVLAGRV